MHYVHINYFSPNNNIRCSLDHSFMPNLTRRFTTQSMWKGWGHTRVSVVVVTHFPSPSSTYNNIHVRSMTPHQSLIHLRYIFALKKLEHAKKKRKEKHKLFTITTTTTMNHLTNSSFFEPSASDNMPPVSNSPMHTHNNIHSIGFGNLGLYALNLSVHKKASTNSINLSKCGQKGVTCSLACMLGGSTGQSLL